MSSLRWLRAGLLLVLGAMPWWGSALAQTSGAVPSLAEWLTRVHQAARQSAYTGTFVVTTGNTFASAKIWNACDGQQQPEREQQAQRPPRKTCNYFQQA